MAQNNLKNKDTGMSKYLSPLAAWALSFGCVVGWGAFVMPGTTFLPAAGPLGSVLGLLIGAGFMVVIAINYSRLIKRYPGTGGAYTYAKEIFGGDHGFLCAWMMLLTYIAVIWANATALSLIARFLFGDVFCFGFSYDLAGYTVYFGEVLLSFLLILAAFLICVFSRQIAKWVQSVSAVLLFGGILVCFIAVIIHRGGFSDIVPVFQEGSSPATQILGIIVLAPWAFTGFETISHSSGEFKFSKKKTLAVIISAIAAGFLAYSMLVICASLARPDGYSGWGDYISSLMNHEGIDGLPTFFAAREAMGTAGLVILGISAFCGIITGVIGNTVALSRLLYTMSKDDIIKKPFMKLNKRGVPWFSICCIAAVSCLISLLGRTAIGWIVDITTVGATIIYTYISICSIAVGRREKNKSAYVTGIIGTAASVLVIVIYLLPNLMSRAQLPTESYLILVLWSVLGMLVFRILIQRDKRRRFGKSFIVWIILFFMILLVSIVWMNRVTIEQANIISQNVEIVHNEQAHDAGLESDSDSVITTNRYSAQKINEFGQHIRHNTMVLAILLLFSLIVIFSIFAVIKRREQDIEAERIQAEETSRAKSIFLSNMSHDLRTPMNAVIGYTALALDEENIPDNIRDYLEKIEFSGKHLLSLINDILDMSRIESGKVELDFVPADLFSILDETQSLFSIQMKSKGLKYTVDYSGVKNRYVICDKNRMDRILLNLVSNAYKFTPEGGSIAVTLKQTDLADGKASYILQVADTGIGMSKEFAEHIFDAFERERTSTVSQLQGTGLGMSIAKSFVELMGGTITVESEKGKGTTFTLKLRFPITSEDSLEKSDEEEKCLETDFSGRRLLVVEDNPINCEIASEILWRAGFEVETAENGKDAVDMIADAASDYYDVILMDILMPVMGGYEATRAIRAMAGPHSEIPIIAITANTFETDRQEAFAAGMNDHVAKPFNPDDLLATIAKYLK